MPDFPRSLSRRIDPSAQCITRGGHMRCDTIGPLHGVPVAVKDLVPTAGIRTTWGSLIFKDHVPDTDAVVRARLKAAGAIIVDKTTTPEFGQRCLTEAPLFGRTRNAWREDPTS